MCKQVLLIQCYRTKEALHNR